MGACIRSHEMTRPAALAARPAFTMSTTCRRIDVDDARLADELQSEIDRRRRQGSNGGLDLRLDEGDRNRPLPVSRSVSSSKATCRADQSTIALRRGRTGLRRPRPRPGPRGAGRPAPAPADRSSASPSRRVPLKGPVVLAHQRGEARREQVERDLAAHAPRLLGELRDQRGDAVSRKRRKCERIGLPATSASSHEESVSRLLRVAKRKGRSRDRRGF